MKILIAADIFPPQAGGPATYVVTLANELAKMGDEVRIVSLNPNGIAMPGVTCHVSKKQKLFRYAQYLWLLHRYAGKSDIVYAMGPVNAGLPASIVARWHKKKFAVKVVGDYAWEQYVQTFGYNASTSIDDFQMMSVRDWKIRVLCAVERHVVKQADAVIVPSAYLGEMIAGWGATNIDIIYNAVPADDVQVVPKEKKSQERWLVTAGRLVPWKGMLTLVESMRSLRDEFGDLKLKIIGDGPERERIASAIHDFHLEEAVFLLGKFSREETLSYMAAADVFVLNSAYEGLSHVLLEAAAQGVPICVSDIPANRSLPIAMTLFPYNDKEAIHKAVAETLRLGKSDTSNVDIIRKTYDLSSMVRKTRDVLAGI